jgi:hypothetical protein
MAELTEPTTGSMLVALVPSVSSVVSVHQRVSAAGGVFLGRRAEHGRNDCVAFAPRVRPCH